MPHSLDDKQNPIIICGRECKGLFFFLYLVIFLLTSRDKKKIDNQEKGSIETDRNGSCFFEAKKNPYTWNVSKKILILAHYNYTSRAFFRNMSEV